MKYLILLITLCMSIACTRKESGTSTLSISIGDASGSLSAFQSVGGGGGMMFQSVSSQSAGGDGPSWNTSLNPSEALIDTDTNTSNNVNCIGVMIEGPESDMRRNTCTNSTTGTAFYIGRWVGGIPYTNGASIQLEVPSGSQRTIRVIGWYAVSGSCTDLRSSSSNSSNMSQPVVIGQKSMDFPAGSVNAAVAIPNTINSANIFDDCNGPDFNFGSGTQMYFGQGTADITLTAGANCTMGASDTCFTNENSVFGANKGATARISNITLNPAYPNEVPVVAVGASSGLFAVGDEVMLHATAGRGATGSGTDYGSCGYRAWTGSYEFARITYKSGSTYRISKGTFLDSIYKDLDNDSVYFDADDLAAMNNLLGAATNTANFCYLQMVKVQQLNRLTISANTKLTAPGLDLSTDNGGGILIMRIKDYLQTDTSSIIDMAGKGFIGEAFAAGHGVMGRATSGCPSNDTSSGGNCAPNGTSSGGGGGHGSTTGVAMGSPSGGNGFGGISGGSSAGEDCGDGSCFGSLNYKIFPGGAGGGANTVTGGAGGGIVMIFANKLKPVNGGGHIFANGNPPTVSTIGGGGAGGSVHLVYKEYDGSGLSSPGTDTYKRPMIDTIGGDSYVAGGYSGGSGAGGRTHIVSCRAAGGINTNIDTSVINVSAGTVASTTNQGVSGSTGSKVFDNILCP